MLNPAGLLITGFLVFIVYEILKRIAITVDENTECFVLSHGKLVKRFVEPGLQWLPEALLPWVQVLPISKHLNFMELNDIQINDRSGTTLKIELWVEYRLEDTYKAIFNVEDWQESLKSSIVHAATAVLSSLEFNEIIQHRTELENQLRDSLKNESERWGLNITGAMIQNIGLLPEVAKELFDLVAARIEKTKALIEEKGRLAVEEVDATVRMEVANLRAVAESQELLANQELFVRFADKPQLLKAFQDYLVLRQTDPQKVVSVTQGEVSILDKVANASQALETLAPPRVPPSHNL